MNAVRCIILSRSDPYVIHTKYNMSLSPGERFPPSVMSVSSVLIQLPFFGTVIGSIISNLCELSRILLLPAVYLHHMQYSYSGCPSSLGASVSQNRVWG